MAVLLAVLLMGSLILQYQHSHVSSLHEYWYRTKNQEVNIL